MASMMCDMYFSVAKIQLVRDRRIHTIAGLRMTKVSYMGDLSVPLDLA